MVKQDKTLQYSMERVAYDQINHSLIHPSRRHPYHYPVASTRQGERTCTPAGPREVRSPGLWVSLT